MTVKPPTTIEHSQAWIEAGRNIDRVVDDVRQLCHLIECSLEDLADIERRLNAMGTSEAHI